MKSKIMISSFSVKERYDLVFLDAKKAFLRLTFIYGLASLEKIFRKMVLNLDLISVWGRDVYNVEKS
jgi:hypothetical protein